MYLTRSIDPCLYNIAPPVRAQFPTGWATFVTMKDAFDQCLKRPQVEVAREVLRARDLLIDLEKVALHSVLNEEWKFVSDLNVGIVEALKFKQPVLVALFIARRLRKATASEKAGAIRTVHAQLKELKATGGKGGFAELANWVIPPPDHGPVWGAPPGPAHSPHHASGGFEGGGGGGFSGAGDFGSAWLIVAGKGTPVAARGTTPHKRAVPPGTRGVGRPRRPRGRQQPRPRGFQDIFIPTVGVEKRGAY